MRQVAKGLSPLAVTTVLNTRRRIFTALEYYLRTNKHDEKTRLGDLTLFLLSPLSSLANSFCEDILLSKLSGLAHIDVLIEELMLAGIEDQSKCTAEKGILSVASGVSDSSDFATDSHTDKTLLLAESFSDDFDALNTLPLTNSHSFSLANFEESLPNSPPSSSISPNHVWSSGRFVSYQHSPLYIPNGGY
uniref:NR LBD domain-containing protein n=1 Tax=Angiostrongylus cantonensis TaxID=6313 RepID=A0A0K0DMB1_ANGCA